MNRTICIVAAVAVGVVLAIIPKVRSPQHNGSPKRIAFFGEPLSTNSLKTVGNLGLCQEI